jgi:hypothetical protein
MEKRYQVFISSTYTDLKIERQEVMQALLEMDCVPAGMELFPSTNANQWSVIEDVIDDSDYYVLIVAGRYGSLTSEGLSYTEREFDYAVKKGIHILGFIDAKHAESVIDEGQNDSDSRIRLDAFIDKVKSRTIKTYSSPEILGALVSRGLHNAIKKYPGEGWVRGKYALTPEAIAETAQLKARIAILELEKEQLKHAKIDNIENLSSGKEKVEVTFDIENEWTGKSDSFSLKYSWDEILTVIGPEMVDEKPEGMIRARMNSDAWAQAPENIVKVFSQPIQRTRTQIVKSHFDQILIQLRALGLIVKGEKKRPPSDREAYWRLSNEGDARLIQLLAVKKVPTPKTQAKAPRSPKKK